MLENFVDQDWFQNLHVPADVKLSLWQAKVNNHQSKHSISASCECGKRFVIVLWCLATPILDRCSLIWSCMFNIIQDGAKDLPCISNCIASKLRKFP